MADIYEVSRPRNTEGETMAKLSRKAIDARVDKAFGAACSNRGISVMDIGKVFNVGRATTRLRELCHLAVDQCSGVGYVEEGEG